MTLRFLMKPRSFLPFPAVAAMVALSVFLFPPPLSAQSPNTSSPPASVQQETAAKGVVVVPKARASAPPAAGETAAQADGGIPASELFLPLTPGTYWVYRGTVGWSDPETQKTVTTNVSITTKVEKVYQKPEFTLAVISGYPADLDWATGQVEPKPSLLIETRKHEIFLDALPPDFNYAKLEKDATALEILLSDDNLLFRWPLKKGMKFGDPESLKRDDLLYCWMVTEQFQKNLADIKGLPSRQSEIFALRYATNPDDTEMNLSPGIGLLSYEYHHHGTVADTSLSLVEFHSGVK